MPRKDSASVDIDGLRDQIENHRPWDKLWKSLSLSKKLRYLIEEALGIAEEKRVIRDFLRAIAYGDSTERFSSTYLAEVLELEPDVIDKMRGQKNGDSKRAAQRN
jgi:hypothetical protein